MRKHLLLLIAIISSSISNISAKELNTPVTISDDLLGFWFTPTGFSENLERFAYTMNENEDGTAGIFTVYDNKFQLVSTINVPISEIPYSSNIQYDGDENYETIESRIYVSPVRIETISDYGKFENYYNSGFLLSYGIFGSYLCYVMPFYEEREIRHIDWSYTEWGTIPVIAGYNVYDETNRIVSSIKLPEGYSGDKLTFVVMNNNKYLICEISGDNGAWGNAIYRIENENSISFVKMTEPKVSPRNPRQGEMVTVSIDEQLSGENVSVNVVSGDGKIVMKDKIRKGQTTLDIDTSRFKQGMYVVTVSGNGKTSEAAKIIVR